MKRNKKTPLLIVLIALFLIGTGYLLLIDLVTYAIVTTTVSGILLIALLIYNYQNKDEETIYCSNLKTILKTYDAILVKSNNVLDMRNKNIIHVETIDDLVNAQIEIRKPIYYIREEKCCSFLLLGGEEVCVYILKLNEQVISKVEEKIKEMEEENERKAKETSLFNDIDQTMIIRLENLKSYKVSPIREKEEKDPVEV